MAVETQERAPGATPPRSGMLGYKAGRERPAGGFELWSWLFMRISGIVLLVLAVGHVLIMHVVDEGVDRVDFASSQDRWANPLWRTWDWALLVLSLIHGINGLRVDRAGLRRVARRPVRHEHALLRPRVRAVRPRHDHRLHVRPERVPVR